MKTKDGTPTWAVYGFFKAIFDLLKNEKLAPDAIGVAFDVSHHTFRTEKYTEYKANREAMPDPMRIQMGLIYDGLKAFNIPIYTKEGFEADDVIGTISKRACELGHKVLILTGDQDSFQLVDKDGCVKVIIPSKGELVEYNWDKVYEKLDFLVVNERFMSEEIMYADVVFPATTYYENQIPVSSPLFGWKLRNRIIQPLGEARNDVHILQALAEKMGFGEVYPKSDEDTELWMLDGNRELLEKLKCSEAVMPQKSPVKYKKYQTGDLRKDGMPGFPTPSGKFEICSKLIEECGYTGLPVYKDIRGIKELGSKEEYPMILTTGARSAVRFASFGPAVREIIQLEPYPVADINLEDAKELGINEGQKIWIETVFGKQSFRANICEITRGCIHAPFGSGGVNMLGEWKETNINEVCSMEYHDELSGFLLYKSMPCRVVLEE